MVEWLCCSSSSFPVLWKERLTVAWEVPLFLSHSSDGCGTLVFILHLRLKVCHEEWWWLQISKERLSTWSGAEREEIKLHMGRSSEITIKFIFSLKWREEFQECHWWILVSEVFAMDIYIFTTPCINWLSLSWLAHLSNGWGSAYYWGAGVGFKSLQVHYWSELPSRGASSLVTKEGIEPDWPASSKAEFQECCLPPLPVALGQWEWDCFCSAWAVLQGMGPVSLFLHLVRMIKLSLGTLGSISDSATTLLIPQ